MMRTNFHNLSPWKKKEKHEKKVNVYVRTCKGIM